MLQFDLWFGHGGMVSIWRLHRRIEAARVQDGLLQTRNAALAAQVADLKHDGLASAQDQARSELGMVRKDETFFQVVPGAPPSNRFIPYPDGGPSAYGKVSH